MAVQVQSSSSLAFASGTTNAVITKPTGVALGDLLIAVITHDDTMTPPADWTTLRGGTGAGATQLSSFWKIATATEVSASNFTFTGGASGEISGAMLRIDGFSTGTPIWTSAAASQTDGGQSPSIANTITPAVENSLLIMVLAGSGGTGTVSGYAIATSNPSWTEDVDITTVDGVDYVLAIAHASRPEVTATGNSSASFSGAVGTDWGGQLIAVPPTKDTSITDTSTITDVLMGSFVLTKTDNLSVTDSLTNSKQNPITNTAKNTSTWINEDKS